MGYDKELTKQILGDVGPLRFNPVVIKVCQTCGKPDQVRYKGRHKPTTPYHCRSCVVNRPEVKAKLSASTSKQWEDPEFRAKIVTNSTAIWDDPERRDRMSAFRNNPDSYYVSGNHESPKAGVVWYRSSWELAYFKLLDVDGHVIDYIVEPVEIQYEYNGIRRYVPDVLVHYTNESKALIEIKPRSMLNKPINIAKFAAGRRYCALHNMPFIIITEDDLQLTKRDAVPQHIADE